MNIKDDLCGMISWIEQISVYFNFKLVQVLLG
jgi:hypothetical protein